MLAKTLNPYLRKRLVTAISIALAGGSFSANSQPVYVITDLGALGGGYSVGYDVNTNGIVTGESDTGLDSVHAFSGEMNDIGALIGGFNSTGYGINDSGSVVGEYDTGSNTHAFVYDGQVLDIVLPGLDNSFGYGINNAGHVTGEAYTSFFESHAFYYDGNGVIDIGSLGGIGSSGQSINNINQITGWSYLPGNDIRHAFIYSNGIMVDATPLLNTNSVGNAVNGSGQIAGYYQDEFDSFLDKAFVTVNGQLVDLGTPTSTSSRAYGINSIGQVVGRIGSELTDAFLYTGGQMRNINDLLSPGDSGWSLVRANAINDNGQITGEGSNPLGQYHAFLATPAGTLNWIGSGSGNWDDPNNWELGFLPSRFLDVAIATNSGDITVSGPAADSTVKSLTVGGGESGATLDISNGGNLTVIEDIVISGLNGGDQVLQSTGTTTASSLTLAQNVGSSGTYSLSGNGVLTITDPNATTSSVQEYIGYGGSGTFNQSGGNHIITQGGMVLGWLSGASGIYNLSGTGSLSTGFEVHGVAGTGVFNQSGGTHSVDDLTLGGILQTVGGDEFGSATYTQTAGNTTVGALRLGRGTGSEGTYNLSGTGSLEADTEVVGYAGNGVFNQSGGSNTVNDTLTLALEATSTSAYTLGGSGILNTLNEYVGHSGTANFNQTGGTHIVTDSLIIGYNDGASGTYTQSGGSLTSNGSLEIGYFNGATGTYNLNGGNLDSKDVYVGVSGTGTFDQIGGTHNVTGTLAINSNSSYLLSGGELNAADLINQGTFTQSGGVSAGNFSNESTVHYSGGTFNANLNNTGIVNLRGAGTRVLGGTITNQGGFNIIDTVAQLTGTFNNQIGGSVAGSEILNEGTFNYDGGEVSANLTNIGAVNLNGTGNRIFSGNVINQGDFNINSAVAQVTGTFSNETGGGLTGNEIRNEGTFNYLGGDYGVSALTNTGTVNLSGAGTRVLGGTITNQGSFNITDTVAQITGTLTNETGGTISGSEIWNDGTFNYSGGDYNVSALANTGTVNLNGTGTRVLGGTITNQGSFNITDTVALITGTFNNETGGSVTGQIQNDGTINYSAGSFDANLINNGTVNLTGGGTRSLGGSVTNQGYIVTTDTIAQFAGSFNNIAGGNVTGAEIQNTGIFNYSGGNVSFNNLVNSGTFNLGVSDPVLDTTVTNQGQFNISDAVAQFTSTFNNVSGGSVNGTAIVNSGTFNNSGNDFNANLTNTGAVNLSGAGTRVFNGDVTNQGTFNVIETNVVFNGDFDNQGVYFSDPSVNTFDNLNVGSDGYLVGGAGDQFIVQGNFTNSSTQNVNWDTTGSTLIFDNSNGPATHLMSLASADLGSALTAFDNNFAWGEVILESGQRLTLVDANSTPGAALYASQLTLPNGVSQLNNVSGDYNIYYDPALSSNQYLAGSVFNFGSGIGQLIPQGFSFLTTDPVAEGFTFNESSYAQALNTACPQATGALAQRCRELRVLTPTQRANAIASSTPTQQMAQTIAPIKFNFARMEAPMLRMMQLRRKQSQPSTVSFNGFQIPINLSVAALGLNMRGGGAGDDESFSNSFRDEPFGLFIDGKFTVGNQRENPNNFGFDIDSRAVTVGADYRVTDDFVAGAAMEYMNVNTTFDNSAGTMDSDTFMGAVYGSYRLPEDFYVDAIATYGSSEHALTRTFGYPGFSGNATSKPGADQYTFAVTLGKDLAWEEWQISPYTRFEYLQMHVDSYQENGGGGLAVNVGSQSNTSAISTLGTQVSYNLSQSWGILVPSAWVEWEHQYLNDNERIQMRLSDAVAGTGDFVIQTGQPDRDYVNLGGAISASLPEGKSAFIRYEARLGQTDISNHIVEVGLRIPF